MKTIKYLAPAFVSALAFASTAQASEFEGFYAGGGVGVFGTATAELKFDDGSSATFGAEDFLNKADLIVGYGQQDDGFYIGGEAAYSFGMLDDEIVEGSSAVDGASDSLDLETNGGYMLAGRAGYIVSPAAMAYVKLGYQQREFEFSDNADSVDEDFDGYVVGGGMAYHMAGTPVTVRAEATRTEYGDEVIGADEVEPTETSVDLQAVYRF